ncbi:LPXTG cell wall anchor domain-containing protein [Actinoplanes sp. NPDC049118]|uniref:LPXTG cell wall anchor domain-containing protein n=1 Tax=Actinoplanes sp. NPDC049118 TaxID=3155769 RepID=UPI0033F31D99
MKRLLGLGAAVVALGAMSFPAAASATDSDGPDLVAVTETDPVTGKTKVYPVKPGDLSPAVLGVANNSDEAVDGVVVHIRVLNDLDLPRTFSNCRYYVDSNLDGAWCEFDQELAPGATYAIAEPLVAVAPAAVQKNIGAIVFGWTTAEDARAKGGIEALAKAESLRGESTPGSKGAVALEARPLPMPASPNSLGFAYVRLPQAASTPSTGPATTTPATPAATPTSTGAVAAGGEGGGLPVTGAGAATVAGAGATLLLAGGAGYVVARRRRTRFIA